MTEQEMLDRAISFFLTAKRRSGHIQVLDVFDFSNPAFVCDYRSPEGDNCVIGSMLPSDHPVVVNNTIGTIDQVVHEFDDLEELFPSTTLTFAMKLQEVHDNADNWSAKGFTGWDNLQQLAQNFGLDYPVAENAYASA